MTPLQVAACSGHASVVRLLVQFRAKIKHFNAHGTALSIASKANRTEVMEVLLRKGASIALPFPDANALAAACQSGHNEAVNLVLDELAETEVKESICVSAMTSAAAYYVDEIYQRLIEHVSTITPTMLTKVCPIGLQGSVLKLLDLGVDLNSDDDTGSRAIQVAAFFQRFSIFQLLLEKSADIHRHSVKYGSPLQAILEGHVRCCDERRLRSSFWIEDK